MTSLAGKPGGRIDTNELHTLPLGPNYTVQKKAWMDETVMHEWIDVILEPYIRTAIVPGFVSGPHDETSCIAHSSSWC